MRKKRHPKGKQNPDINLNVGERIIPAIERVEKKEKTICPSYFVMKSDALIAQEKQRKNEPFRAEIDRALTSDKRKWFCGELELSEKEEEQQ